MLKFLRLVRFNVIAFTHNSVGLDNIGKFHIETDRIANEIEHLKKSMNLDEIMYLSTCNRVEFIFVTQDEVNHEFISLFLRALNPNWDHHSVTELTNKAKFWNGINAVNHLIEVASSLDSMVLGEREIITQVREAYELASKNGLSGDLIRIVIQQTIATAKKVYTETEIATKPVSVVSLAYHSLISKDLPENPRLLIIGSGVTNQNMCRFLKNDGYKNFAVFNRTFENSERLANELEGKAYVLDDLKSYKNGFDIMLTCTAASEPVINEQTYKSLLNGESNQKIIIDLAIPPDLEKGLSEKFNIDLISVEFLKTISEKNLKERKKELIKVRQIIYESLEEFKEIFKMREVELKMRTVPERVKEIRATAINEVFSKELNELDENSKVVLDKILNYMEKKYISVPMLAAKELVKKKKL